MHVSTSGALVQSSVHTDPNKLFHNHFSCFCKSRSVRFRLNMIYPQSRAGSQDGLSELIKYLIKLSLNLAVCWTNTYWSQGAAGEGLFSFSISLSQFIECLRCDSSLSPDFQPPAEIRMFPLFHQTTCSYLNKSHKQFDKNKILKSLCHVWRKSELKSLYISNRYYRVA